MQKSFKGLFKFGKLFKIYMEVLKKLLTILKIFVKVL